MTELLSPVELASLLKLSTAQVIEFTRDKDWPHIRFTNKSIRFTEEHVAQILAKHEYRPDVPAETRPAGTVSPLLLKQTKRSRARSGS